MRRAFRHGPPELREINVIRPAVQRILAGRFDRRLTTVHAGAGFGKTTALARAMAENRLSPTGIDVWVSCEPDDDADALGLAIAAAIADHTDTRPDPTTGAIAEAIAGLAPIEVCLIVDDAHLLEVSDAATSATAWLGDLFRALPANGHVVWSSRSTPPFDSPDRADIDERTLLFSPEERRDLVTQLGGDTTSDDEVGGWPALIDVAARHGTPLSYIDERVLRDLGADAGVLLDALIAAGRADRDLLAAVCPGADVTLVERLPLIDRAGPEFVAHDIWHELRSHTAQVDVLRSSVADELARRGEYPRAVDVLLATDRATHEHDGDDGSTVRRDELLVRALHPNRGLDPTRVRRWDRSLEHVAPTAATRLLHGLVHRLDEPAGDPCVTTLTSAAELFVSNGDERGEAIALSALTYPLHVRQDADGLRATLTRLAQLAAAGIGEAEQQSQLGQAIVATALGDLEGVEAITRPLVASAPRGPSRTAALWMLCNALNGMGRSSLELADELADEPGQLPGMIAAPFTARWQLGLVDELVERAPPTASGDRDRYVLAVWHTFLAATTGDDAEARRQLAVVRDLARAESSGDGSNVFTEAVVALETDRADEARELVQSLLAGVSFDGPARGFLAMGAGLIHVLLPEHRDAIEALDTGPLVRQEIELAMALTAVLERDESEAITRTPLPDHVGKLLSSIGLRYTSTYLAAASALGVARADELAVDLVDLTGAAARNAWSASTDHPNATVARGATDLLAAVPVEPAGEVVIRMLGSTELEIDGHAEDSADWRRERVRALLAFVLLHPSPTRELVMAELWPDADGEAARRNLRSTLNRLHRVLEPGRGAGHAPFHVRSIGQQLSFQSGNRIRVDVHDFLAHLDRAAALEADGTPSRSVEHYLAAIELYRGDLLPDSYSAWVLVQRDALRARFVHAGVRCAELLTAAGRHGEAIAIAEQILPIEPYSEAAHRALISAHLADGDVTSARRSMATCESLLQDVGGIAEPATAMVERRIRHLSAG